VLNAGLFVENAMPWSSNYQRLLAMV